MSSPQPNAPIARIRLPVNPADATLADALRAAAAYWRATPAHWVLPVVAVALVNLLAVLVLGGAVITSAQLQEIVTTGPLGPQLDGERLPRIVAGPLAVGVVTVVARWFLVANAIAGLRGREIGTGWVIGAGLRAFTADLLVSLTIVMVGSTALALGATGILVVLALVPIGLYVGIRLQLWTTAIFDGRSVLGGASVSWRVTRGGVLRVIGWTAALFGIGVLAAIPLMVVDILTQPVPAIGAVLGGAVETAVSAFTVIVVAILYESQRLRTDPVAYQASLASSRPAATAPDASDELRGPYDPPPPPTG